MSTTFLVLTIGGVLVVGLLIAHYLRHRDSGGYRRRFDSTATRNGEAFPVASTLYVGDGGDAGHSHHQHSTDCAHTIDAGGGCSDGGGGSN